MRKPVDGMATLIMLMLCLVWGAQQVAIKAVGAEIAPMMQVVIRSGIAAFLVWFVGLWILRDQWIPHIWNRGGLVVGLLFACEFLFIAEGLRWTSASHMAVFLYTAPLFAAIGLHLRLPEERLTKLQWVGMGVAFSGIAATFLTPREIGSDLSNSTLWGDFLALCGGIAWGCTTVAVRTSKLSEAPASQALFYQLSGAFVFLLPVTLLTGQTQLTFTALSVSSLVFQTVVVSFASYLIWFWILRRYLAARLGVLSFMTPLFGVLMGVMWLDERITSEFLFGAALTLVGLVIVNAPGAFTWATKAPRAKTEPSS